AVTRRDREALAAEALDEHLVRAELVAGGAEAPARKLLEVARLQRLLNGRQLLAEPRPEHGEIRLHAQLGFDGAQLDLLDVDLVRDLVGMARRRTLDDEPAQRLAQRQP